jgi:hypothetical protein
MAYLFNGVRHNIANCNDCLFLPKSVDSIESLLLCYGIPLRLRQVNMARRPKVNTIQWRYQLLCS